MKIKLSLFALLISLAGFAQQGINYKAIIKDNAGIVIANDLVIVQFSILQGIAETNVYTETHTPTTDANGLVILNIGEGTQVSGDYATIDWGVDTHALNVQLNTGGGLVDMGTTTFQRVPYAMHASVSTFANTSGDTKWIEGTTSNDIINNNTGKVEIAGMLQVQAAASIDEFSIDGTLADNSDTALPTEQAVKTYVDSNLATGLEAIDEGNGIGWRIKGRDPANYDDIGVGAVDLSFSPNNSTTRGASGGASTAMGQNTTASGGFSTAMGIRTVSSGLISTAMGSDTEASGTFATAMGGSTIASGDYSVTMGCFTAAEAFASTAMGNGTTASGLYSTAMGDSTTASGLISTAMGSGTTAIGISSTAMGSGTTAFGISSTAIGTSTFAEGPSSFAAGEGSYAGVDRSTAMGFNTSAVAFDAMAFGVGTVSRVFNETVIGSYNSAGIGSGTAWVPTENLFVVGNGPSEQARSNAFSILKNGKVGIGTNVHTGLLSLGNAASTNNPHLELTQFGANTGARINFVNGNELDNRWTLFARTDNTDIDSEFNFFYSGLANNIMSLRGDGNVYVNGVLAHSSDRRLKRDINDLSFGLNEILQMEPKEYFWKDKPKQEQASLGLIAQEVRELIPNVVLEGNDENKTLSVSYTELIPVLINAVKEQQQIILGHEENYKTLLERVEALEADKERPNISLETARFTSKGE